MLGTFGAGCSGKVKSEELKSEDPELSKFSDRLDALEQKVKGMAIAS